MTILDWILIGILGFFFVRGLFRGFLLELFDVVSLVGGYLAARFLGSYGAAILSDLTPLEHPVSSVASAILLFIIVTAALNILARILRKIIRMAQLGFLDRIGGGVLGSLKALIVVLSIALMISFIPLAQKAHVYINEGMVSRYFWFGTKVVKDQISAKQLAPTQVLSKWLRSAGVDDEIVHIIVDQPELMDAIMDAAPKEVKLPKEEILKGNPNIEKLKNLDFPPNVTSKIVEYLERSDIGNSEKAKKFWEEVEKRKKEDA